MQQKNQNQQIFGIALVVLGGLILLANLTGFSFWGLLWPFFVIVPGAFLLLPALRGDRAAGTTIPGAIVTGTGLILLYQNITDHWESWAYAWALYPVFFGFGLWLMGRNSGDEALLTRGRSTMRTGLMVFLGFALFFELILFGGFGGLLPLLIIAVGLYMLLQALGVKWGRLDFSALSDPGRPEPPKAPEAPRPADSLAPRPPAVPEPPLAEPIPSPIEQAVEDAGAGDMGAIDDAQPTPEAEAVANADAEADATEDSAQHAEELAQQLNDQIAAAAEVAEDMADRSDAMGEIRDELSGEGEGDDTDE